MELEEEEIRRSFKGGIIALVGLVSQRVSSVVSGIVVARVIGPELYGVFSAARSLTESINNFTKFGFDLGLVRRYGEETSSGDYKKLSHLLWTVIFTVLILSILIVGFIYLGGATYLERNIFRYRNFSYAIVVVILMLPLMSVSQVLSGAFRGALDIKPSILSQMVLQPWTRLLLIIILFSFGWRFKAVLWATVFSYLIAVLFLFYSAWDKLLARGVSVFSHSVRELIRLSRYSGVLCLSSSASQLLRRTDILMLGYFVSAGDTGRYAVVQILTGLILIFNVALNQLLGPEIAGAWANGDYCQMKRLIKRHVRWVTIVSLPLFLTVTLFGGELVSILGSKFKGTSPAVYIVIIFLALSSFSNALLSSSGFLLSMTGKHIREFIALVLSLALNATLNYLFIPRYGIKGAAVSTFIATCAGNTFRVFIIYYSHRFLPVGREVLMPLAIGLLAVVPFGLLKMSLGVPSGFPATLGFSLTLLFLLYFVMAKSCLSNAEKRSIREIVNSLPFRLRWN